jgi:putative endonuclease
MSQKSKKLGQKGEELALCFLKKKKFKILIKNYRCRFGEIDIIARDKKTITFIEVKTRSSQSFGLPQESVPHKKQLQICKVALDFIQRYALENQQARFDVLAIKMSPTGHKIDHIQNAFDLLIY